MMQKKNASLRKIETYRHWQEKGTNAHHWPAEIADIDTSVVDDLEDMIRMGYCGDAPAAKVSTVVENSDKEAGDGFDR